MPEWFGSVFGHISKSLTWGYLFPGTGRTGKAAGHAYGVQIPPGHSLA